MLQKWPSFLAISVETLMRPGSLTQQVTVCSHGRTPHILCLLKWKLGGGGGGVCGIHAAEVGAAVIKAGWEAKCWRQLEPPATPHVRLQHPPWGQGRGGRRALPCMHTGARVS